MISITIKWETKQAQKTLNRMRRSAPAAFARAVDAEIADIMDISKARVPVAEGELRQSAFTRRRGTHVEFGYEAEHAIYIHEGIQGGFMPPVEPFERWLVAKGGDPRAAFIVAKTVGERGLQPNRFLRDPIIERSRGMAGRIAARVRKDI